MFDEGFAGAASNLNQTVLGSVLLLVIIAFALSVKMFRQDLKELQERLEREQAAHQKTREEQIADIRNMAHVAASVEGLKSSQEATRSMMERFFDRTLTRGRE